MVVIVSVNKYIEYIKKQQRKTNFKISDNNKKISIMNIILFLLVLFLCFANVYNIALIIKTNENLNEYKAKLSKYETQIKIYKSNKDKLESSKKEKNELKANKKTELESKKKIVSDLNTSIDALKKEVK